jgi:2-haloacid dehalogenase
MPGSPRSPFVYVVLRVVPHVERGEYINAGIILWSRPLRFLGARVHLDPDRLAALSPGCDPAAVSAQLDAIERVAAGDPSGGPIARLTKSERFHWLASPSSTMVQRSEVHTGMTADAAATLGHLFGVLVAPPVSDADPAATPTQAVPNGPGNAGLAPAPTGPRGPERRLRDGSGRGPGGSGVPAPRRAASRMTTSGRGVHAVVFDLGGVLIDWNPRHLYRGLFEGDDEAMEAFLGEVCTPEWNSLQDAGRPWDEAVAELVVRHPDARDLIVAFHERWDEMLGGPIEGMVEILRELQAGAIPLYALSNWSAEKFPVAKARYPFLAWFRDIVISGDLGTIKPDPAMFRALVQRAGIDPATSVYVDDSGPNVAAAAELGFAAIRFVGAGPLRRELASRGLPVLERAAGA